MSELSQNKVRTRSEQGQNKVRTMFEQCQNKVRAKSDQYQNNYRTRLKQQQQNNVRTWSGHAMHASLNFLFSFYVFQINNEHCLHAKSYMIHFTVRKRLFNFMNVF
jgi:hypothetical protein